jgi:hypothetical protein
MKNIECQKEYNKFQKVLGKSSHWNKGEPIEMFLLKRTDGCNELDIDVVSILDENDNEMLFNTEFEIIEILESYDVDNINDVFVLMKTYNIKTSSIILSTKSINCSNYFILNEDLSVTEIDD